jgi:HPt (histidine-containing phosphotransfer) domain-containing protein
MTAGAMQGDREKCLDAGMNDYVTKPVSPQALAEALEKWLPKKKGEGGRRKEDNRDGKAKSGADSALGRQREPLIFDRAGMMARLMDDEDMARTIACGFLEDLPRQIGRLKDYLEAGNVREAEVQAHAIKGASANVGGDVLRAVAYEMEKSAKQGDLESVTALWPELELQFCRLRKILNEFITPK